MVKYGPRQMASKKIGEEGMPAMDAGSVEPLPVREFGLVSSEFGA